MHGKLLTHLPQTLPYTSAHVIYTNEGNASATICQYSATSRWTSIFPISTNAYTLDKYKHYLL